MNVISPKNKWIGQRTLRPDGIDKVIGSAQYAADFSMSGMVWGKVLRSQHAHAVIKKIDTSKAEELDGVLAVMTGDDLPLLPLDVPLPSGTALRCVLEPYTGTTPDTLFVIGRRGGADANVGR